MVRIFTSVSAVLLAGMGVSAMPYLSSSSDPRGKVMYISHPNKDTVWHRGESVHFNWLNAPHGTLQIKLISAMDGSDGSDADHIYIVAGRVGSRHGYREGKCDSLGTGESCGRFDWVVPDRVQPGRYQAVIEVNSADHSGIIRYTDDFVVQD